MWEVKDYWESQIMCNWSESETFGKYGFKLQDDGLKVEMCKLKMIELF